MMAFVRDLLAICACFIFVIHVAMFVNWPGGYAKVAAEFTKAYNAEMAK